MINREAEFRGTLAYRLAVGQDSANIRRLAIRQISDSFTPALDRVLPQKMEAFFLLISDRAELPPSIPAVKFFCYGRTSILSKNYAGTFGDLADIVNVITGISRTIIVHGSMQVVAQIISNGQEAPSRKFYPYSSDLEAIKDVDV